jgi:hypothetical protein
MVNRRERVTAMLDPAAMTPVFRLVCGMHEAGHVVVAHRYKIPLAEVGLTVTHVDIDEFARVFNALPTIEEKNGQLSRFLGVLKAGGIVDRHYSRLSDDVISTTTQKDEEYVNEFVKENYLRMGQDETYFATYVTKSVENAESVLFQPGMVGVLASIAMPLSKGATLNRDEIADIIRQFEEASQLKPNPGTTASS